MANSNSTFSRWGTIVIVVFLLAALAAAGWFAVYGWSSASGAPMPTAGYVAMILGIVFSLVIGCGLMALVFYSSRHGYDEQAQQRDDLEPH
jgi:fatty acid desaturase